MKALYLVLTVLLLTIAYGCSSDSSTGSGGIGGGPTGGGAITFTITGQGDPNSYNFGFKPSVDTKLTKLIASVPSLQFFDTLTNNNTNYVFSKDTTYALDPYQGVQTGQQWTFTFTGTIVSSNTGYTVSTNYTVP
jgi:hypothetical protein